MSSLFPDHFLEALAKDAGASLPWYRGHHAESIRPFLFCQRELGRSISLRAQRGWHIAGAGCRLLPASRTLNSLFPAFGSLQRLSCLVRIEMPCGSSQKVEQFMTRLGRLGGDGCFTASWLYCS